MRRVGCAILLLLGCESSKPADGADAEPTGRPQARHARMADQRGVKRPVDAGVGENQILPSVPGVTDGREMDAGIGFREEARRGCSDTPCIGANCSRLCAQWTSANSPSAPELRNKVYLGCLAKCLPEAEP